MKHCYFLFLLCICVSPLFSQDTDENASDTVNLTPSGIDYYDCYNKLLSGDSVRYIKGKPCQGWIKDHYPSGQLIHNGLYEKGKLTAYKNYYENAQIERSFIKKDMKRSQLTTWYENGQLRTEACFYFETPLKWTDYYINGNIESLEEYDKGLDYYIQHRYYYEDGKPYIILDLLNKKLRIYSYKEYYSSGEIKEEGQKIHNRSTGDYPRIGIWNIYDENGKLIRKEQYDKGLLISEELF